MTSITENDVPTLEESKKIFNNWWESTSLGNGDYLQAIASLGNATNHLPSKNMILFFQTYRFGFNFFYGKFEDENRFIPISYPDGILLKYQKTHEEKAVCPIQDPKTKEYFIPNVEVKILPPPSGSMPTEQHLDEMIRYCDYNRDYYRILQVLTPYAKQLKEYREYSFKKIAEKFPEFIQAAEE